MKKWLKHHLLRLLAIIILLLLYSLTLPPTISKHELDILANDFKFEEIKLHEPKGLTPNIVRQVHPKLDRFSAWISSVGAAISIADIDNDGQYDDLVHVDPRFDKVIVSPAIPMPSDYKPFFLEPEGLLFDKETMSPMGTLTYDFNSDGRTDVLVYYWGRTPIIFYQQTTGFLPTELDENPQQRWFSNAATLSDFDGDGQIDILVTNYFKDGSRILDEHATDNDQEMHHSFSRAKNGGGNHFYLNKGLKEEKAVFEINRDWENGISHTTNWTLAVAAADLDGDLRPEIYFANDLGTDMILHNLSTPGHLKFRELKGKRQLTTIPSSVMADDSFKGMGADFADLDMDGDLDLYVSNIADEYALLETHFMFVNNGEVDGMKEGHAPFVDKGESLGLSRSSWGWESKLADFNNDGQPEAVQATGFVKGEIDRWPELQELAMANDELTKMPAFWPEVRPGDDLSGHPHNPFFVRASTGRFFDIAPQVGLGREQVTRGVAIGDLDNDGDRDFVIANQWNESYTYINQYEGKKTSLRLHLYFAVDTLLNTLLVDPEKMQLTKAAIGAEVRIKFTDGKKMIDFVDGGNGHSGTNSKELFFGLGDWPNTTPFNIELKWRDQNGKPRTANKKLLPGFHTIILP